LGKVDPVQVHPGTALAQAHVLKVEPVQAESIHPFSKRR
jgi:hypothetical protein